MSLNIARSQQVAIVLLFMPELHLFQLARTFSSLITQNLYYLKKKMRFDFSFIGLVRHLIFFLNVTPFIFISTF